MGDYTVRDLYDKFFSLFEPYEYQDGIQTVKRNCYEDQLVTDPRSYERTTLKGDRWYSFTGNIDFIQDDELNNYFSKLLHLIKINDRVRSEGSEGLTTLNKEYQLYMCKLFGKKKRIKGGSSLGIKFFSCVPKHRIGVSEGEVKKLQEFLKKFVNEKYFFKYAWCIESGKHPDKPNLHFHLLGHYNDNGIKNFRGRVLKDAWNKFYPDNPLEWNQGKRCGIHRVDCNCPKLISDKLKYFHNESKGSHENFLDLDIYEEAGNWEEYRGG